MDHLIRAAIELIGGLVEYVSERGFPRHLRPGRRKRKKTEGEGGQ